MKKKKTVSPEEYEKLKRWYAAEIRRKDKKIDELEFHNKMLLKSSIKQSERNLRWGEYAKKMEKRLRAPKENSKSPG